MDPAASASTAPSPGYSGPTFYDFPFFVCVSFDHAFIFSFLGLRVSQLMGTSDNPLKMIWTRLPLLRLPPLPGTRGPPFMIFLFLYLLFYFFFCIFLFSVLFVFCFQLNVHQVFTHFPQASLLISIHQSSVIPSLNSINSSAAILQFLVM